FCLLAIPGVLGYGLLAAIRSLAAVGIARSVLGPQTPPMRTACLYVAVGGLAVPFMPLVVAHLQTSTLVLVITGDVLYVVGAAVYALRRPDPLPRLFGYHEVFHLLVIVAGVRHFAAVSSVVAA
ncbi:MAG: hemolysin III family protein, partial [Planctomycetota bacterium]